MTLANHLGLLAEPVRVRLLAVLVDEELGVGELTRVLQLPQSTVSRHLKALRVAGWVVRRAEGNAAWFRMSPEGVTVEAWQLWDLVFHDFARTHQREEDRARLDGVLRERRVESAGFFGRTGAGWDALRTELFGAHTLLPTVLSLLPDDLVVADFGCGTGEALRWVAPVVGRAIGVDRETAMLDAARVRLEGIDNVSLRQGALDALPLADGEVDAALLMLVLHHVAEPGRAFEECARVLRPGGRAVLLDMVAHDRVDWKHTMGHVHLGFTEADLVAAAGDLLGLRSWRALRPDPTASGPPLFVAIFEKPR